MAAHLDPQDCPPYSLHYWNPIRPYWCSPYLGKQSGMSYDFVEYNFLTRLQVTEMTFDYTDCDSLTPGAAAVELPNFNYQLRSKDAKIQYPAPTYSFAQNSSMDISNQNQCTITFTVPADLQPSILLYYKLTNFFQNHRRYVKSLDANQLKGKYRSASQLHDADCKPVDQRGGKPIYPCGLIANSMFNG